MKSVKPSYLQNLSEIRANLDQHQSTLPGGFEKPDKSDKPRRFKITSDVDSPEVKRAELSPISTVGNNFELPPISEDEQAASVREDAHKAAKKYSQRENRRGKK